MYARSADKRASESELIKTLAMLHEATSSLDRWHLMWSLQLVLVQLVFLHCISCQFVCCWSEMGLTAYVTCKIRLSSRRCLLLLCDEGASDGPRSLYICERWCPLILTIQPGKGGVLEKRQLNMQSVLI